MKAPVAAVLFSVLTFFACGTVSGADLEERILEGEYEEVIALLGEGFSAGKLSHRELLLLALAFKGTGDYRSAESVLRELLRSRPGWERARLALAELHLDRGRVWEALSLLRSAGESERGAYLMGISLLRLGFREQAEGFFSSLREGSAESDHVARIRDHTGRFRGAVELTAGYDTNPTIAPQLSFISPIDTPTYGVFLLNRIYYGDLRLSADILFTRFERVTSYNTLEVNLRAAYQRGRLLFPVRLNYVNLGGDLYRLAQSAGVGFWSGGSALSLIGHLQNYRDTEMAEENRDGYRISVEGEHLYPVWRVLLKISADLTYEDTKGRNWDNVSFYPRLSVRTRTGRLSPGFFGGVAYYIFLNRNTLTGERRRDLFLIASPSLRVFLSERLFTELTYIFRKNISSVEVLGYVRHTFTVGAGGVF